MSTANTLSEGTQTNLPTPAHNMQSGTKVLAANPVPSIICAACMQLHHPAAYHTIPAAEVLLTRNNGMICLQASKQEIHGLQNFPRDRIEIGSCNCEQWQRVAGRFALLEITWAAT